MWSPLMHALCYPLPLCTLASDAACTVRGHRTALGCSPSVHFRRRLLLPYTYSCDSKVTDPSSSSTQSKIQLYVHCTRTPLPTIAPWVHSHWGCGSSCGRSSLSSCCHFLSVPTPRAGLGWEGGRQQTRCGAPLFCCCSYRRTQDGARAMCSWVSTVRVLDAYPLKHQLTNCSQNIISMLSKHEI